MTRNPWTLVDLVAAIFRAEDDGHPTLAFARRALAYRVDTYRHTNHRIPSAFSPLVTPTKETQHAA